MWQSTRLLASLSLLSCLFAKLTTALPQGFPSTKVQGGCWKDLAPIASGERQEHSSTAVGSNIYIIGGMVHGGLVPVSASGNVEVYNVESGKWSGAAPLPLALHHANVAAVDGKIYILGGITAVNSSWQSVPNCYKYDPVANEWKELPPMPAGTGRGSAAVGVSGKSIYLAGGIQIINRGDPRVPVAMVSSYDTVSGKWSTLPNLGSGEGRDHGGGAVVNSTFYVVGGRVGARESVRGTVFAMDLTSPDLKWVSKAAMPTPRGGIAVAVVGNKIYAIGGEGNPAAGSRGVFPNNEAYDVVKDVWQEEAPMKVARHGMQAVAVGETIYLPGGGAQSGFGADLAIFDAYKVGACS